MSFVACALEPVCVDERELIVKELREAKQPLLLVLSTCQRLESFGELEPHSERVIITERWENAAAIERLARIAAGLESRILGELEILGQVREAHRHFLENGWNDKKLARLFQEIIAIARRARRESGIDAEVTSLSAIGARQLLAHVPAGAEVAVVGSGSLAASTARYLKTRGNMPIRVAGRCPEHALQLALEVQGFASGLENLAYLFKGAAGIVTATAAPHPVIYPQHLKEAARPLVIVDLADPPDCSPDVAAMAGINYYRLSDIESQAQTNLEQRKRYGEIAVRCIREDVANLQQRFFK